MTIRHRRTNVFLGGEVEQIVLEIVEGRHPSQRVIAAEIPHVHYFFFWAVVADDRQTD